MCPATARRILPSMKEKCIFNLNIIEVVLKSVLKSTMLNMHEKLIFRFCLCRSLGVHCSKVRSLTLDTWEPELVKVRSQ